MGKLQDYLQSDITMTPAVVCYLIRGNKVLLGLRKKVSSGLGQNLISGIGGKVGDLPEIAGETADEALAREVLEEIGVKVTKFRRVGRVRFLFPCKPKWNQDVVAYIVEEWEGEPRETEAIEPMWFELGSLPAGQMWDDNKYWVPRVLAGECVDVSFLYDDSNSKVAEYKFE